MNANKRMKYASTPTYGMQKRGFSKKAASPQSASMPDFLQPSMPAGIPFPQASPQPFSNANLPQTPGIPQISPFFQNTPPMAPMNAGPAMAQAYPMPGANFPQPTPVSAAMPAFQQPLGNSVYATNPQTNYMPRQQGFVPPPVQTPAQPPMPSNVIPVNFQAQAAAQPVPANYPPQVQQGGLPYAQMPAMFPGQANVPPINSAMPAAGPSMQQQQPPYASQPYTPQAPRASTERDKLWSGFLFGLLPVIFISCLFLPKALDFLRYAFIVLCVMGLGAMWYRQMFASSTRMTVSIIYAALCIVTISLLVNNSIDNAQPASAGSGNPGIQASASPDPNSMAAGSAEATPQVTPSPTPSAGPSEAEQRLDQFMTLWSRPDIPAMVNYVLPSWARDNQPANGALFELLLNRTPEDHTIESISGTDTDTSRTVTLTALINKNNGKEPVLYRYSVIMTKDGDQWYVDPASLATTNEVSQDNAQASPTPTFTMPPQMTATPKPAANTLLYYNADGGKYYHADPNCPSVNQKYLPLQGSFTYSELGSHLGKLTPCLECGSPTTVLEE